MLCIGRLYIISDPGDGVTTISYVLLVYRMLQVVVSRLATSFMLLCTYMPRTGADSHSQGIPEFNGRHSRHRTFWSVTV